MGYAEYDVVIRSSSRTKQILAGLLVGAGAVFSSANAFAQAIALNAQSVVLHYNRDGSASAHPNGSQPTWISHADCEANVYVSVPLTLTGSPLTYPIQVWAGGSGADCTQLNQRGTSTQVCWQVSQPIAPQTSLNVNINAQDIVAPITASVKPTSFTAGTAAACDSFSQSGPVPVNIYFMFLDSGGNLVGTDATYALSVALIGPAAPTNVIVGPGDTLLKVDWTPASDANTQGFQVFCDPPPGKESQASDSGGGATIDASTVLVCDTNTEDGGFDDAGNYLGDITIDAGCHEENQGSSSSGGATGTCNSSEIFSGGGTATSTGDNEDGTANTVVTGATPPPANIGNYSCGNGGNVGSPTSTEAVVTGLQNGQKYVVGVAAYDVVGNIGPMSAPQCDDPTPVNDFFKDYINDGGGAGGGFCSVDKNEPAGTSAFVIVGLASLAAVVRRRKNKSEKNRGAADRD